MNIAIVGAGIGGLTTALFLEKLGITVHIFEQASEIKPVGAGIILAHNAMQVFDKLGIKDLITRLGNPLSQGVRMNG
ncbi:FAD-dependent monooxygenase [Shewanella sp. NIFS-20-20]|uniref:FAD-dependent monooxygenase n=1 Tax=Shewanella sp. NIFS-20-20 TaxID=2853806 RepID=UPI001C45C17E|nr:FAD-dependent monooxygenase [Shewanella sp. NIFS-20-20]MBV7317439.1 FAD-dependent monooxygenase [Shewanella sp. NIFS-20-20]